MYVLNIMYRLHRRFEDILADACKHHDVVCQPLSDHWVFELQKGAARWLIYGYDLGLNTSATHHICKDKVATYSVLHHHNIPAVEHTLFMAYDDMLPYLEQHGTVVVKRNDGSGGKDVFCIKTADALKECVEQLFNCSRAVALSPYYAVSKEYRVIMLADNPLLVFSKTPAEGEWKHNLASGAKPQLDSDAAVIALARQAATAVKLAFGVVDIVATPSLKVLEINSSVMLEHFMRHGFIEEGKKVYEQAMLMLVQSSTSSQSR